MAIEFLVRLFDGTGGRLKVLGRASKGFKYGTKVRSKSGFPYMGMHQKGGGNLPQRKSIFLNRQDLRQIIKMAVDHLKGREVKFKKFVKAG